MKKKIAIVVIAIFVISLSLLGVGFKENAQAKAAQIRLEIPGEIKKENIFTVKVRLESDVQLYSIDAYLSYNAEYLEFVPDNEYVTGSNGILELKDLYEVETKEAVYEITFKAIATGETEIALEDVHLIDYADLDYITVTAAAEQFTIGVNEAVVEDARLADLIVAPGVFTEEFNPEQLSYEMYVGLDVERVGVSAIPMHEDSMVGLDMPEQLQEGKNVIKITVTALSGTVTEYVIVVYRGDIDVIAEVSEEQPNMEDCSMSTEEITESETNPEQVSEYTEDVVEQVTEEMADTTEIAVITE